MNISILGCGWLGLPLADHLIQHKHTVKGSTTSRSKVDKLRVRSIEPYLINLNPRISDPASVRDFWESDVLVLNVPPGRKRDNVIDFHTRQIESVIDQLTKSSITRVIFVSSTSVYPKNPGTVYEEDTIPGKAGRDSGNALIRAEKKLIECKSVETTVIRFGGLYGGDRHPAKYMAGRTNLDDASAPVNLIHRDDCIAIITKIIEEDIKGAIFNAVSDGHPTRKEYYSTVAKKLGLKPPTFKPAQENKSYKIVSNEKLKEHLNYHFIHPEPSLP